MRPGKDTFVEVCSSSSSSGQLSLLGASSPTAAGHLLLLTCQSAFILTFPFTTSKMDHMNGIWSKLNHAFPLPGSCQPIHFSIPPSSPHMQWVPLCLLSSPTFVRRKTLEMISHQSRREEKVHFHFCYLTLEISCPPQLLPVMSIVSSIGCKPCRIPEPTDLSTLIVALSDKMDLREYCSSVIRGWRNNDCSHLCSVSVSRY